MPRRVIAIVGATATGKTALGISLAQALDGEIINADSRQVYRRMDIGTAKPTPAEQSLARHHLIDIVDPDEPLTLASYLDAAKQALDDVLSRDKQPIIVGGTGQYIWALLEGWRVPRVPPDRELRARLEQQSLEHGPQALLDELRAIDAVSAERIDSRNTRRMIRAIEVTRATGRPFSEWQQKDRPDYDTAVLGLRMERPLLHARIDARVDAMMGAGLVNEVRSLNAAGYGCDLPAMSGIGYRQICEHLRGERTLDEAVARIKTETHRLARVQHAWFKLTDSRIHWLEAGAGDLLGDATEALAGR